MGLESFSGCQHRRSRRFIHFYQLFGSNFNNILNGFFKRSRMPCAGGFFMSASPYFTGPFVYIHITFGAEAHLDASPQILKQYRCLDPGNTEGIRHKSFAILIGGICFLQHFTGHIHNGDLIVLIEEKEHEHFDRDGNDIYYDLLLSIPDAVLGTEVEVPTLKGKAKVKIEPGTQPGKLLRMKDRGIQGLNNSGRGDQFIKVNMYVPKDLSDGERRHIEALRGNEHFAPESAQNREKGFFSKIKDVFA